MIDTITVWRHGDELLKNKYDDAHWHAIYT